MSTSSRIRVFFLGLLITSVWGQAFAQDKPNDANKGGLDQPESGTRPGYRLQESDDLARPHQPLIPRSAAVQAKVEALTWYMLGRLYETEHRNEPRRALIAFRKAIQLDPTAIEIYRELIPLEFQFENVAAAIRYAKKAVELDPQEYKILEQLGRHALETRQIGEAIKYFEQAIHSARVDKESVDFVMLNRDLGILYAKTGQADPAGACYEVIFDAIKAPEKYDLDNRLKNALLGDAETNYERIGQVLLDAKKLQLALEAFELSGKIRSSGFNEPQFNRAKILFLSEKYVEALAELQTYFDKKKISKGREPYQLLADILKRLNRSDELIGRLQEMTEDDSQNVALQFFYADQLADAGELDKARKIYDTMLLQGGDAAGYGGLVRILRKMKKSEDLLDAFARGMAKGDSAISALEPELKALSEDKSLMAMLIAEGKTRAEDKRLKFEEAYLLAKLAADLKDPITSGEFYRLAIAANRDVGNPGRLMELRMQLRIEMAEMYATARKHQQAAEVYKEIVDSRQLNEIGQKQFNAALALELAHCNRTDDAIAAIAQAIKLDDDNWKLRNLEAFVYVLGRRWDEAIQKYEQLMKDFSDDKEVVLRGQCSLSNVYVQKGEQHKGEEILEKALESNPDDSQVNNDLGYLWADQGKNLERAEKMIRKALAAEPENGSYLDSLGWVLFKLGRLEEALPPLEQSTKKIGAGGDGTVWDHIGDVQLKLVNTEKAVEAWKTALSHLEAEESQDAQLLEKIKDKLKQYSTNVRPKPAEKGAP